MSLGTELDFWVFKLNLSFSYQCVCVHSVIQYSMGSLQYYFSSIRLCLFVISASSFSLRLLFQSPAWLSPGLCYLFSIISVFCLAEGLGTLWLRGHPLVAINQTTIFHCFAIHHCLIFYSFSSSFTSQIDGVYFITLIIGFSFSQNFLIINNNGKHLIFFPVFSGSQIISFSNSLSISHSFSDSLFP